MIIYLTQLYYLNLQGAGAVTHCQNAGTLATILIPSDQTNNVFYCGGVLNPSNIITMTEPGVVRRELSCLSNLYFSSYSSYLSYLSYSSYSSYSSYLSYSPCWSYLSYMWLHWQGQEVEFHEIEIQLLQEIKLSIMRSKFLIIDLIY